MAAIRLPPGKLLISFSLTPLSFISNTKYTHTDRAIEMASDTKEDKAFDIKKLESHATNPINIDDTVGITNVLTISC